jgi:hypothetical protein
MYALIVSNKFTSVVRRSKISAILVAKMLNNSKNLSKKMGSLCNRLTAVFFIKGATNIAEITNMETMNKTTISAETVEDTLRQLPIFCEGTWKAYAKTNPRTNGISNCPMK